MFLEMQREQPELVTRSCLQAAGWGRRALGFHYKPSWAVFVNITVKYNICTEKWIKREVLSDYHQWNTHGTTTQARIRTAAQMPTSYPHQTLPKIIANLMCVWDSPMLLQVVVYSFSLLCCSQFYEYNHNLCVCPFNYWWNGHFFFIKVMYKKVTWLKYFQ